MSDEAYPPEPWHLRGWFCVGVFLVPRRSLPEGVLSELPPGARPLTVAGRAIVGVSAVTYVPGGMLDYDELLVALPVVRGGRLWITIPQIWVTSPASRSGGRALWGIPKQLTATRRRREDRRLVHRFEEIPEAAASHSLIAEVDATASRAGVPGRWKLPLPTLQREAAGAVGAHNTVRGRLRTVDARWRFAGPLAWLAPFRPVLGVAITHAAITFGERVERTRVGRAG
ncbi:acetoacetate decarboxylase family protein [Microbacterium sp. SS28]|uniref:acetoacetate decarboxylase family protein n=1 Tax=Microbacterium sp. SS28 TaxID=2919948 RepID=UPI001FA9E66F|nr:acetoacetate decarboxylase family protein [Microbacterium sp. SS28]